MMTIPKGMTVIRCGWCGEVVSTPVPERTVVRAWVECQECIEQEDDETKQRIKIGSKLPNPKHTT